MFLQVLIGYTLNNVCILGKSLSTCSYTAVCVCTLNFPNTIVIIVFFNPLFPLLVCRCGLVCRSYGSAYNQSSVTKRQLLLVAPPRTPPTYPFHYCISSFYQDFPDEAVVFSGITVTWSELMNHAKNVKSCIQVNIHPCQIQYVHVQRHLKYCSIKQIHYGNEIVVLYYVHFKALIFNCFSSSIILVLINYYC